MAEIAKGKTVTVRLPKNKDDKGINYVPVCIDGHVWQVQRGVAVEVPQPVYDLLEKAGYLDN
jgi:hypothetical protein